MATLDLKILEAALADGLIGERLSDCQRLYLHQSILTADSILQLIRKTGTRGATPGAIAESLDLNRNTVNTYCRFLFSARLLRREPERTEWVYFSVDHSDRRRRPRRS